MMTHSFLSCSAARTRLLVLALTFAAFTEVSAADAADSRLRIEDVSVVVSEGAATAVIVVERSDDEGDAGIDFSTEPGTAVAPDDFTATSGSLFWPDGDDDDRRIAIPLADDTNVEVDETFFVVLSNPTPGVTLDPGRDRATVTVQDDDGGGGDPGTIKFDETSVSVSERAGFVSLVVERSGGEDGAVTVDYITMDGTATSPSDYQASSGTLSWGDGDGTDRVLTIALVADTRSEPTETFLVRLTSASGGAVIDPLRSASTVRIESAGAASTGELEFDQRSFTASESQRNAVITVERSGGEDGAVSVSYATFDGSATAGADYETVSGVLDWADGDSSLRTFLVPILRDSLDEGPETVRLELSAPTGGAALDPVRGTAVLTIEEEAAGDQPRSRSGQLEFARRSGEQIIENAGTARIGVERSRGSAGNVSVEVTTTDGSAVAGLDYQPVLTTLFWGSGDSSPRFVDVPILDDGDTEGNEILQLSLRAPTGGAVLDRERQRTTLTILDDDGDRSARCDVGSQTLCLQQGRFEIDVVWRSANGDSGRGFVRPLSAESGIVWFFDENNVEMLIKTLDACRPFDSYWVFFAATTDLDFTVTVRDTTTGLFKEYRNRQGTAALPVQDTLTFRGCQP